MKIDVDAQNEAIVAHLRHVIQDLIAVYRFGSTAHGTATGESDTDIALLAQGQISGVQRFDIQEGLAAKIRGDVDIVDLSRASTVMAMQVIANGQLLYDGDAALRGQFEDLTFGAYARLNEERRGILDRVSVEGTVYGR